MTVRLTIADDSVPRLAPHMRLRRDTVRGIWTIQAPERSFALDDTAHAVISRCDGASNLAIIIDHLCADFSDAPRATIEADVVTLLQDLADKGVITA